MIPMPGLKGKKSVLSCDPLNNINYPSGKIPTISPLSIDSYTCLNNSDWSILGVIK